MQDVTITDEQEAKVRELLSGAAQWFSSVLVGLGMSIPILIAQTFIFLALSAASCPTTRRLYSVCCSSAP